MKEMISDYVQSILSDVSSDVRSGKRLIALVGILGDAGLPEEITKESLKLSRLIVLKELFNSLVEPISNLSKRKEALIIDRQGGNSDVNFDNLLTQIEETRKLIGEHEAINYPLLISWIVKTAKGRKLLSIR